MKKVIVWMLASMMALSICACGSKDQTAETQAATEAATQAQTEEATEAESTVAVANPWTDCATLAEAEKISGITYSFRECIGGGVYYANSYRATEGMMDVDYTTEGETETFFSIRQAKLTDEDISGDYNTYSHDFIAGDAGVEDIRFRGSKDTLMVCSFNYGNYSYVLYPGYGDYEETIYIISEMTGIDPEEYADDSAETDAETAAPADDSEDEPVEGAPTLEADRLIDEDPIDIQEIAGVYDGINYGTFTLNVYSSPEGNYLGRFEVLDDDNNNTVFMGEFCEVMTNYYEMDGEDVSFTVYTDNGNYGLDFWVNGQQADYFVKVEDFQS